MLLQADEAAEEQAASAGVSAALGVLSRGEALPGAPSLGSDRSLQ